MNIFTCVFFVTSIIALCQSYAMENSSNMNLHQELIRSTATIEKVKNFVENNGDVNQTNSYGNNCLDLAVTYQNKLAIIECLVNNKANIHETSWGKSVLCKALESENINPEVIQYLIEKKADIHQKHYGLTLLCTALKNKNITIETIKHLVENKATIDQSTLYYWSPLYAALNNKTITTEIVEYLVKNKANIHETSENSYTYLHTALRTIDNIEIIRYLVDNKVNIHTKNSFGSTPFHEAVTYRNSPKIIEYLITNKADQHQLLDQIDGSNALHLAMHNPTFEHQALHNRTEIIQCLITHKLDPHQQNYSGISPLFNAAQREDIAAIETLGKCGVDIATPNEKGETILSYMRQMYYEKIHKIEKPRSQEQTTKIILFLLCNKQQGKWKLPKPLLVLIFKVAGIPAYGQTWFAQ